MANEKTLDYRIYDDIVIESESSKIYRSLVKHKIIFLITLVFLVFGLFLLAAYYGPIHIDFLDVLAYIFTFDNNGEGRIVWNVRLVRVIAAILAGAGLAVSGVVMQCILRNPLASPYTLGLSGAAAFGAAFSIVFVSTGSMISSTISINNPFLTTIFAFAFSMLATGIILLMTKITNVSAETMVLAGIAISAIFSAGLSLVQYVATDAQLANIVSWSFGDLGRATWSWDLFVFAVLLPISLYFIYNSNSVNLGIHSQVC